MKVEFLESFKGQELTDDIIKQIQAESGKDVTFAKESSKNQIEQLNSRITELQSQVSQRDTDLNSLKEQLTSAGQSASKLSEVQKSFEELQTKYDTESKSWKEKLDNQAYQFAVQEAIGEVKFSCGAAKKQFVSDLMENKLPIKDGKLLGFSEYLEEQKKADASNFAVENPNEEKRNPTFMPPVQNTNNNEPTKNEFGWNFLGVRKKD